MNIQLIKGPRMAEETIEVEKGISIEELYKKYEDEFKNTNKEIKDFYNYYYSSVLRKLKS